MELVIKIVNTMLAKALYHRQFKIFLVDLESEYKDLLINNAVAFKGKCFEKVCFLMFGN